MLEFLMKPEWIPLFTALSIICGLLAFVSSRRSAIRDRRDVSKRAALSAVTVALAQRLPNSVFVRGHPVYESSLKSYWAAQQQEMEPECVFQPRSEDEIATAVRIIKADFDKSLLKGTEPPRFAIRGGGHSALPGFSNCANGVVFDMSLFKHVDLTDDRASVSVGAGARWYDVSRKLDPLGLAVAGGRNGDVGVGGLTLGGGYSFFSPRVGFVCDNVLSYRIVLASGEIVTASEHQHRNLWRVLKGGGNNFGIVTSFTLRVFPATKIWGGFLFMFSSKAQQVVRAFHESLKTFDEYASGPMVSITWMQKLGFSIVSTHVMYTKPEPWPAFWRDFRSIGRIWSTAKVRTLSSATDELDRTAPAGSRWLHISTVVKNDLQTLQNGLKVFERKKASLRKVKGLRWTLVYQPVHASTMQKGRHNVLGLCDRKENLVVALFAGVWENAADDALVNVVAKEGLDEIRGFAIEKGTADDFCYINWFPNDPQPFESYGEENMKLMKDVSREIDADGLFQLECVGGYKLPRPGL